jgi:aryl-alcohol dehydrogenase-like predicted oxidoreductase
MRILNIPGSKINISRIGLGCARLGNIHETNSSAKIIQTSLDSGITHFDTSPFYGSEELLGHELFGVKNATVTTKFGLTQSENKFLSSRSNFFYRKYLKSTISKLPFIKSKILFFYSGVRSMKGRQPSEKKILSYDFVMRELDQSLTKLKRDFIDIYLVHEPERFEITDDLIYLLESLKNTGVICSYGFGFNGVPKECTKKKINIQQCRYAESLVNEQRDKNIIRIYHGVIRSFLHENYYSNKSIKAIIKQILDSDLNSAILFSPSTVNAIKEIL